jgi:hypothetical protein
MSSAFNPVTIEYYSSIHSPDFGPPWVLDQPEADALYKAGVPIWYWKVVGGVATEMTQAEKDAVNAANLNANRDANAAILDNIENILRAVCLVVLDQVNGDRSTINAILTAVDQATTLADLKTRIGLIADLPTGNGAAFKTAVRNKLGT